MGLIRKCVGNVFDCCGVIWNIFLNSFLYRNLGSRPCGSHRALSAQPHTMASSSDVPMGVFGPLIHGPHFKLMKFLVTAKQFLNDPDLQTGPHTVGREEILKAVTETQEWFNENRQHDTDSEVTEQFEKLKGVVMPMIAGRRSLVPRRWECADDEKEVAIL